MAADHERLDVIDQLLQAGTPIDAVDPWGRQALRLAAGNGRVASVRLLLARGPTRTSAMTGTSSPWNGAESVACQRDGTTSLP